MSKRNVAASISFGLLILTMVGCASDCGQRMTFREWMAHRPRPIRDLLNRGDDCNTCKAPAGQLESYGGYEMGGCESYDSALPGGVGYYPSDMPAGAIPMHTSNRIGNDFAPAITTGSVGSGTTSPKANVELETPPFYGKPGSDW